MTRRQAVCSVVLTLLIWLAAGSLNSASAQFTPRTLQFQNQTRTWFEYVPSWYDGSTPLPLVIGLHGSGGNGRQYGTNAAWAELAEIAGFIVACPNAGRDNVWNTYYRAGADDVGWLLALLNRLQADYTIDAARVFMTGHSNGASMTNSFAGRHAERLTAIAPVSGAWITTFGLSEDLLMPSVPLPVWTWRGERENFTTGLLPRNVQDQQQKQFWMRHNQVHPKPDIYVYSDDRFTYTTEVYSGNALVLFTEVARQNHPYQAEYSFWIWYAFFGQF